MVDVDGIQQERLAALRAAFPAPVDNVPRVFDGGLVNDAGQNIGPPTAPGSSRVLPHAICYWFAGLMTPADLGGQVLYVTGDFVQVTCVGATKRDALWAVTKVRSVMNGQTPQGFEDAGLFQETTNAGPIRIDRGVQPNRFYLPLIYGLTAT